MIADIVIPLAGIALPAVIVPDRSWPSATRPRSASTSTWSG